MFSYKVRFKKKNLICIAVFGSYWNPALALPSSEILWSDSCTFWWYHSKTTMVSHRSLTHRPKTWGILSFTSEIVQGRLLLRFLGRSTLWTFLLSADFKVNPVIKHFIGVALQGSKGQGWNSLKFLTCLYLHSENGTRRIFMALKIKKKFC